MKKIVLLSSLIMVLSSLPVAANEGKMAAGVATAKLQKKQMEVHLEHYGDRHIFENNNRQSIGLYKIIVGNPLKLQEAMSLNRSNGFDGLIFTTSRDKKYDWQRTRVHRPVRGRNGWKESSIGKKDMLPYPFNTMADDLLNKIRFFNVYPDNDDVTVVYIVEGTKFSDCEKIFDCICKKKKQPEKKAGV